jgi:hypothetical protein
VRSLSRRFSNRTSWRKGVTRSDQTSEARQRDRASRNASLFREVKGRLEQVREPSLALAFLCECARGDCEEEISLTGSEYSLVRAKPRSFAVKPGHVDESIEAVARKTERHWIVEKTDRADSGIRQVQRFDGRSTNMNGQGRL